MASGTEVHKMAAHGPLDKSMQLSSRGNVIAAEA